MINKTKYLLASTAIMACMIHIAPAFSDTTVQETTTVAPGSTTEKKTVTETTPDSTSVSTTVTTDHQGTDGTETHYKTEQHTTTTDTRTVNLMDYSNAGVLSPDEVGKMLFKIFDADGNGVIDSNEYERHISINFSPLEKNTIVTYKLDRNGETKETTVTYENFMQNTRLMDFNNNGKGISPHEFTGMDFMAVDVNRDHAIDLKEWQGTYNATIDKKNKENAGTNTNK
jgi:hypothetical protein